VKNAQMSAPPTPPAALPRTLSLADAAALVVGIVVGAGIFLAPRLVAQALPSASWILAIWIASGVLCFFGALAYAEMGAMMPETGGHYVIQQSSDLSIWAQLVTVTNSSQLPCWPSRSLKQTPNFSARKRPIEGLNLAACDPYNQGYTRPSGAGMNRRPRQDVLETDRNHLISQRRWIFISSQQNWRSGVLLAASLVG
jgi:hypothetical protein